MSSTLQEIRAAAEPYKSFPKAVAAVVCAMFDKGATQVTISFNCHTVNMNCFSPKVSCDVWWCNRGDLLMAASHVDPEDRPAWALASVHHAKNFCTDDQSYVFINLGSGDGSYAIAGSALSPYTVEHVYNKRGL